MVHAVPHSPFDRLRAREDPPAELPNLMLSLSKHEGSSIGARYRFISHKTYSAAAGGAPASSSISERPGSTMVKATASSPTSKPSSPWRTTV